MSRASLSALPFASLVALAAEATRILDAAFPGRSGAVAPLVDATLPRAVLVERVRLAALVGAAAGVSR